ncbi:MAG: tetratricopeptide repeat protein [Candidatus Omnitrophica bacterium]|nr:tetratricopeptide repeat protein [Candidatus Omnitrophota bacterium]
MKRIFLLLAFIAFVAYCNTLGHSFVWDDHFTIEENDLIRSVRNIPDIFKTDLFHSHAVKTATEHSNYYRPIQALSFLLDYHVWQLNPFGYHLTSVLLHVANGILVFMVVFLICKSRIVSMFTSILFLVHPVQTGAVTYLTGRSDVLACFFVLLSLFFYLLAFSFKNGSRNRKKVRSLINSLARNREFFFWMSVLAFALALLSKETAVIYPLVLIAYELSFNRNVEVYIKDRFSKPYRYIPYVALDIAYIWLRLNRFNFTPAKHLFQNGKFVLANLLTMGRTLMEYISLLIYPTKLHMEREVLLITPNMRLDFMASILGFVFLAMLLIGAYKKSRTTFFGLVWFLLFLVPVSNIIPINALMAEHWLYIPSIGFFVVLSILLVRLPIMRSCYNLGLMALIAIMFFYSSKTILRNQEWQDDLSIYFATLRDSPRKAKMCYNIGTVYYSKGDLEQAIKYYDMAIQYGIKKSDVYTNLGVAYMSKKAFDEAEFNFNKALKINPKDHFAYNGLGGLYEMKGNLEKAVEYYNKAISVHPDFYDSHVNLGVVYDELDDNERSIEHFRRAFEIKRDGVSFLNLARSYEKAGFMDKAEQLIAEQAGGLNLYLFDLYEKYKKGDEVFKPKIISERQTILLTFD